MKTIYSVIYKAKVREGSSVKEVIQNLSVLGNTSIEKAEVIVASEKPRVLKNCVSRAIAEKYASKFLDIGMEVEISESLQKIKKSTEKGSGTNATKKPSSKLKDGQELATRGSRFSASIIDAITVTPIVWLIMYFTGGYDGFAEGQLPSLLYTLTFGLIGTATFLLIHGKLLLRDGQTWGKRLENIKIVTIEDKHANLSTLSKRYVFYWGLPLIPIVGHFISMINILFIFSKSKRCIHDYIGNTKVVQANK